MTPVSERVVLLDGVHDYGRDNIGNKGHSILQMRRAGLPVPPAFVLPIDECRRYHAAGEQLSDETWKQVLEGLAVLERDTGRTLGDSHAPLLVSVRSGAAVSMPGMMDTVLNLGITDEVERALKAQSGNAAFARETHARFCFDFGRIVLKADIDPPAGDATASEVRDAVLRDTGQLVPTEPLAQLRAAIHAVFDSWGSRRAVAYRRHWGLPQDGGTAVIVQAMVFGNLSEASGTGVLFTRDPLSGERRPYGEWLPRGQGDDVVGGTHDCLPLADLETRMPELTEELLAAGRLLEETGRDVQDIEFTIESGRLFLLQTRSAKRAPAAAARMAVDLVDEGMIDRRTALSRVTPEQVLSMLAPRLSHGVASNAAVLARGVPACPGVGSGSVVGSSDAAEAAEDAVVLARSTTSPDDVSGMIAATAVITEQGGATSHAAVVSRALGRPSVVGVGEGTTSDWAGRDVTVDGTAGIVYEGLLPTEEVRAEDDVYLSRLLSWAQEVAPARVEPGHSAITDVDLDPGADPVAIEKAMAGAEAVRGAILATPDGARAVVAEGTAVVVPLASQHPLVLLLRLLEAQRAAASRAAS